MLSTQLVKLAPIMSKAKVVGTISWTFSWAGAAAAVERRAVPAAFCALCQWARLCRPAWQGADSFAPNFRTGPAWRHPAPHWPSLPARQPFPDSRPPMTWAIPTDCPILDTASKSAPRKDCSACDERKRTRPSFGRGVRAELRRVRSALKRPSREVSAFANATDEGAVCVANVKEILVGAGRPAGV